MITLDLFKHLLPSALAWVLTINKQLRQFFEGLVGFGADIKSYLDLVWLDIFPDTTREITTWERQFGLSSVVLTEQERRDRLTATWRALGDQDISYIQNTLQENGFDVHVHEWYVPGSEPTPGIKACAIPRNPLEWIEQDESAGGEAAACGETQSLCGEPFAQCGNRIEPLGYVLVNKVITVIPDLTILCGDVGALCGEPDALFGNYVDFEEIKKVYIVPNDPALWPYFLYIGGETFGQIANVAASRRNEFEALCLKICPSQQWLGMLVQYS